MVSPSNHTLDLISILTLARLLVSSMAFGASCDQLRVNVMPVSSEETSILAMSLTLPSQPEEKKLVTSPEVYVIAMNICRQYVNVYTATK